MQRVEPLDIILAIGDQYHAAANRDEIRVLHGNGPSVRQANPERLERALVQPVANGFSVQHRLPIVDGIGGVRKETQRLSRRMCDCSPSPPSIQCN